MAVRYYAEFSLIYCYTPFRHGVHLNQFKSNLQSTIKFVSLVYFPISIYIIIDSLLDNNYENALIPLYMLFLLPSLMASVYIFSKLEGVQLNKYIKAVIFSVLSTLAFILFCAAGDYLDAQELNLNSIFRFSILSLIIQALLYIQLPWSSDSDV